MPKEIDVGNLRQVGGYDVVRPIAEGGMSWVFEVMDPRLGVSRALKLLKPHAAAGEQFRRFEAEARSLARLEHPNIVTIFDFGRDEKTGCFYYTMSLIDGAALSELGFLSTERVCDIVLGALSGLTEIHNAGIIHRDIKPGNILVGKDGRSFIADLGIARSESADMELTRTGMIVGTLLYASPEQIRGQHITKSSDVFSMGLTLYKVITGESVYDKVKEMETTSGQEVMMYLGSLWHSGSEISLKFPSEVPAPLRKVISRACSIEPEKRYPDARAMRVALESAASKIGRKTGRRAAFAVAIGTACAAAVGAYVFVRGELPESLSQSPLREAADVIAPARDVPEQIAEAQAAIAAAIVPERNDPGAPSVEVEALLEIADRQFDTDQLTVPDGDNALDSYRSVLAADPENQHAAARTEEIRRRQFEFLLAEKAEAEGDLAKAVRYYEETLLGVPGDHAIEQHVEQLRERMQRDEQHQLSQQQESERQQAEQELERIRDQQRLAAWDLERREKELEARIEREREQQRLAAEFEAERAERQSLRQAAMLEAEQLEREAQETLQRAREVTERLEGERTLAAARAAPPEPAKAASAATGSMLAVPAGAFSMGNGAGSPSSTSAFSIDRSEVTVSDYAKCVAAGSCSPTFASRACNAGQAGRGDHPINCASFDQAEAYCRWSGKRIPTGAEWEKAARGESGQTYPWGNAQASCDLAVVRARGCATTGTAAVGSRPNGSSPYGAVDMLGNVWEWTEDAGARHPTLRGGAWNTPPVPASHLYPYDRRKGTASTGFRCAK